MVDLTKIDMPKPGSVVQIDEAIGICMEAGHYDLAGRIEKMRDKLSPFKFDGCSKWFQSWHKAEIWRACFIHDCAYLVGGTEVERLLADARLMMDIAVLTNDIGMAHAMFAGVRAGGGAGWKKSFSWGFGRQK